MANQKDTLEAHDIGLALVFHTIRLQDGANAQDFEELMLDEIFPVANSQESSFAGEGASPDTHRLLASNQFDKEYTWMIQMEYFIHHTPLPNWLSQRAAEIYESMAGKIEEFGEKTGTKIMYDVREWRQRLGLESE
jgi:hypothetical protein